jgi:hypothetical protein
MPLIFKETGGAALPESFYAMPVLPRAASEAA